MDETPDDDLAAEPIPDPEQQPADYFGGAQAIDAADYFGNSREEPDYFRTGQSNEADATDDDDNDAEDDDAGPGTKAAQAQALLESLLAERGGEVSVAGALETAEGLGLSSRTMRRAAQELGLATSRSGFGAGSACTWARA